jgi:small nuclear ribonucleoprotein (snRNP)-like protein
MEGIEVIVELKTGKRHLGILTAADEFMNLTLERPIEQGGPEQAEQRQSQQQQHSNKQNYSSGDSSTNIIFDSGLSSLDIRGSNIRYIHFPDNSDLTAMVTMGVERERTAAKKYNRGKRK